MPRRRPGSSLGWGRDKAPDRERASTPEEKGVLPEHEWWTGQVDADVAKLPQALRGLQRCRPGSLPLGTSDAPREHGLVGNTSLEAKDQTLATVLRISSR